MSLIGSQVDTFVRSFEIEIWNQSHESESKFRCSCSWLAELSLDLLFTVSELEEITFVFWEFNRFAGLVNILRSYLSWSMGSEVRSWWSNFDIPKYEQCLKNTHTWYNNEIHKYISKDKKTYHYSLVVSLLTWTRGLWKSSIVEASDGRTRWWYWFWKSRPKFLSLSLSLFGRLQFHPLFPP